MGERPAITSARRKPKRTVRYYAAITAATIAGAGLAVGATIGSASAAPRTAGSVSAEATGPTVGGFIFGPRTPIRHLVVIFHENVSFDHYFGTYPNAANTDGSKFSAASGTPTVNGLTPALLSSNPNEFNPQRLSPSQALTCDQDHAYTPEQKAFDGGKMDAFVQNTDTSTCTGQPILFGAPGLVMDYYDGNTVTGLWNYAQNYAMSDNNWDTTFGPSTPGALNLIAGNTSPGYAVDPTSGAVVPSSAVSALNSN